MEKQTYKQGLVDGKLKALEVITTNHDSRLNHHSARIKSTERLQWVLIGGLTVIQILPTLQKMIN